MKLWCLCVAIFFISIVFEVVLAKKCIYRKDRIEDGRRCRRPCAVASDCKARQKTCNCDGDCGMTCYNPEAVCVEPESILNGRISKSGITMQSTATYSCNNGFVLSGNQIVVCCADKKWHPAPPVCKRGCPKPGRRIASAYLITWDKDTFEVGQKAWYKCRTGYYTDSVQDLAITCEDSGRWSIARFVCLLKICEPLPQVTNGEIKYTAQYKFGTVATLSCIRGYDSVDIGRRKICMNRAGNSPYGVWSDRPFGQCTKKRCPPPVSPTNGVFQYISSTENEYGTRISYRCDFGYRLEGNSSGMCDEFGFWGNVPHCIVDVNCTFSLDTCGYINHGWQRQSLYGNDHHMESSRDNAELISPVITPQYAIEGYICLTFTYRLGERAQLWLQFLDRYPNDYAEWSSHPQEKRYTRLDSFLNVPISQILQYTFKAIGSVILYDINARKEKCYDRCEPNPCKNGGTCVSRLYKFTCFCPVDYTGNVCETDIKCSEPLLRRPNTKDSPQVIYASEQMLLPGSSVTYECINNYKVSDQWGVQYRITARCTRSEYEPNARSRWEPLLETIQCQEILCPPPYLGNWKILISPKDSWHVGETATARCKDGYGFFLPRYYINTLTCTNTQSWSGSFTRCQGVLCLPPRRTIENGYRLNLNDTTVVYKCNSLFKFYGTKLETIKAVRCMRKYYFVRSQWSSNLNQLRCEHIKCEKPAEQWQVQPYAMRTEYLRREVYNRQDSWNAGEEAYFKCNKGYKFNYTSLEYFGARCLSTGQWVASLLPCVEDLECSELPEGIANGRRVALSPGTRNPGSNAKYQCNEGYIFSKWRFYPTSMNITCTKKVNALGSEWIPAPSDLSCEVKTCSFPDITEGKLAIPQGKVRWRVGETLTVGCKQGYGFVTESYTDTISCTDHEKWNTSLSNCQTIRCRNPEFSVDANMVADLSRASSGQLAVNCKSRYRFIDDHTKQKVAHCRSTDKTINGVWDLPLSTLRCEPDVNCAFWLDTCGYEYLGPASGLRIDIGYKGASMKNAKLLSPMITQQYATEGYICLTFKYLLFDQSNLLIQITYDNVNEVWNDVWSSNQKEKSDSWWDSFINIPINQSIRYQFKASGVVYFEDIQVRKEACVDRCEPNPCLNGGSCVNRVGRFQCFCPMDYVGERCEIDKKCSQPPRTRPNTTDVEIQYESGNMFLPYSRVSYNCITNNKVSGQNEILYRITSTCTTQPNSESTWIPSLEDISCTEILCGSPELSRGQSLASLKEFWRVGETVTAKCENNYRFSLGTLTNQLTCTKSQEWNASFTPCEVKSCTMLDISEGQYLIVESRLQWTVGETVTIRCKLGYEFVSYPYTDTISCMDHDKWNSSFTKCQDIKCVQPPQHLPNTTAQAEIMDISGILLPGSTVTYQCIPKYKVAGSKEVLTTMTSTCSKMKADGGSTWTPALEEMKCQEILCNPPEIHKGHILVNAQDSWHVGDTATVRCKRKYGFSLERYTDTLTCNSLEKWNSSFTLCQDMGVSEIGSGEDAEGSVTMMEASINNDESDQYIGVSETGSGEDSEESVTMPEASVDNDKPDQYHDVSETGSGEDLEESVTMPEASIGNVEPDQYIGVSETGSGEDSEESVTMPEASVDNDKPDQFNNCMSPEHAPYQSIVERKEEWKTGDVATFRCDPGYEFVALSGRVVQSMTCMSNGRWSEQASGCMENTAQVTALNKYVHSSSISTAQRKSVVTLGPTEGEAEPVTGVVKSTAHDRTIFQMISDALSRMLTYSRGDNHREDIKKSIDPTALGDYIESENADDLPTSAQTSLDTFATFVGSVRATKPAKDNNEHAKDDASGSALMTENTTLSSLPVNTNLLIEDDLLPVAQSTHLEDNYDTEEGEGTTVVDTTEATTGCSRPYVDAKMQRIKTYRDHQHWKTNSTITIECLELFTYSDFSTTLNYTCMGGNLWSPEVIKKCETHPR